VKCFEEQLHRRIIIEPLREGSTLLGKPGSGGKKLSPTPLKQAVEWPSRFLSRMLSLQYCKEQSPLHRKGLCSLQVCCTGNFKNNSSLDMMSVDVTKCQVTVAACAAL
jgi:hypothetical protein